MAEMLTPATIFHKSTGDMGCGNANDIVLIIQYQPRGDDAHKGAVA
ncbi:hypothetical protein HFN63_33050 [Rhizobium leguminosarum]|nr:hypothetical protein [Rhizobium leguminosarum]MBY5774859.1 hypothetical protein [Rhizobium leguminosarum]